LGAMPGWYCTSLFLSYIRKRQTKEYPLNELGTLSGWNNYPELVY